MAPTPPSADVASSASPHSEDLFTVWAALPRSDTFGGNFAQPCQANFQTYNKLELIEQELQSIKQVVHPHGTNGAESNWTPPTPQVLIPNASENHSRTFAQAVPQAPTPLSEPSAAAPPSAQLPEQRPKSGPTQARMLGEHMVSGEDIDWYFNKFLQCFHPALPILRKRDPDECYEASPILFWVIIYVTCRRYTKDRVFFRALVDHVEKEISITLMDPVMTLETAHAALFLCSWPLPVIRLLTDSSTTYISIVMTGIMMIGVHTGRGSHKQFCVGTRRKGGIFTDEEAASTWMACCVLAQNHGQAPSSEVARWEQEFETLRPAIIQSNTDLTYALSLSALLEIQTFYFSANPEAPPHIQRINYLRAFNTARSLISTVLEQESRSKFLTHATNQIFRSLIDAACIVTSMLYSTSAPPDMSPNDANQLAQHAAAVLHRCSVEESDLPHRIGVIIETFWNIRHLIPRIEIGPRAWSDRLGVGMSFWCLELYKRGLRAAQKNSETAAAANRADELIHAHCRKRQNRAQHSTEAPAVENGVPTSTTLQSAPTLVSHPNNMLQPMAMGPDIFQEIDWSMFTDDFGWIGDEGVLLGLP
ncbi:Putative transcription factor SEF1 [Beauveria bassiana D1-5]|uniref:Putative transcription factor SEF1 n=1 Tax=Beauveria bassiana D1-5 TaxID=1245745 RepID=A0A0A2VC47_BEABA|nr:Putative transcription factor SEF1 [Beauveria bassiana D1-5]